MTQDSKQTSIRAAGAIRLPEPIEDRCPARCIGMDGGVCLFLTPTGRRQDVPLPQLADIRTLYQIFDGQMGWLCRTYPASRHVVARRAGGGEVIPIGINVERAANYLYAECVDAFMDDMERQAETKRRSPGVFAQILAWVRTHPGKAA